MKNIICLLLICTLFSCDKYSRKDFSFERMDYEGDELKINGYFYREFNTDSYEVFYLYKNGVIYGPHIYPISTINELEDFLAKDALESNEENPTSWGVFKINGKNIIIEEWGEGTGGPYPVIEREGIIENNNSINFSVPIDVIFEFQEFSPKRDSINEWIE